MQRTRPDRRPLQLDLLVPPQPLPHWLSLPTPTRQQTVELLAQLLRDQRLRSSEPSGEIGDE